jgi:hypothetical protein
MKIQGIFLSTMEHDKEKRTKGPTWHGHIQHSMPHVCIDDSVAIRPLEQFMFPDSDCLSLPTQCDCFGGGFILSCYFVSFVHVMCF